MESIHEQLDGLSSAKYIGESLFPVGSAEHLQTLTPRRTISITTGLAKNRSLEGTPTFKPYMAKDTSFIPHLVQMSQLKDVVKNHNYSFWHFEHNYRNGENFLYSTGIILDIDSDSGMTLEEGKTCAEKMDCYVLFATSQNHFKDKTKEGRVINGPCFRVIIPTERLFHTWSDLLNALHFVNNTFFQGKADLNAMKSSQFFIPSPDNATIIEIQNDKLYDPDDLRRSIVNKGGSVVIVRDAWSVEKCSMLKDDHGRPLVSLPTEKTRVYCPFCDDVHSETVSAFLMERKEGEDRRAIQCSHCKKMYISATIVLTDDQFFEKVCYTSDSFDDTPEPVMWIVQDVVGRSEIFSCYGDPGSGKSTAIIQLAISVADTSGTVTEWLGYSIKQHGPVLYILTDGSHRSLRERIRRISGYLKVARPKDLMILHNQGVYSVWRDDVARLLKVKKPIMVILDSLAMSSDKGDENQAEDQKELAKLLQVWSLENNLAFCVIHHTNKASANLPMQQNNFRGSSYWIGIISSLLEFRKCEGKRNQYRLVKSRDGSPDAQNIREVAHEEYAPSSPGTYNLNPDQIVNGYRYIGPVRESAHPGRKVVAKKAQDVFKFGETKTYKQTLEAIEMKYNVAETTARETLREWKAKGDVVESKNPDKTKSYTFNG